MPAKGSAAGIPGGQDLRASGGRTRQTPRNEEYGIVWDPMRKSPAVIEHLSWASLASHKKRWPARVAHVENLSTEM
jgi:hypothetical protein